MRGSASEAERCHSRLAIFYVIKRMQLRLLHNLSGDDHFLYFGSALVDRDDPGIAVHSLKRVVAHVAVTAVDLECLVSNLHANLCSIVLGDRGELGDVLAPVKGRCCLIESGRLVRSSDPVTFSE